MRFSSFPDEMRLRRVWGQNGRIRRALRRTATLRHSWALERIGRFFLLCAITTLSLQMSLYSQTKARIDFAVVVNSQNPVDNISLAELRKIFLAERQFWNTSTPVVPLIRPQGTPEREVVLRVLFRMTEVEFKKYWITKVFRAEATNEPTVALTNEIENDAVVAIPGAIACENAKDVRPGVKVLDRKSVV